MCLCTSMFHGKFALNGLYGPVSSTHTRTRRPSQLRNMLLRKFLPLLMAGSSMAFGTLPTAAPSLRTGSLSARSLSCSAAWDSDRLRIFLVRHGAVDLTQPGFTFPKDCMYGGANVPLSELGKAEARAAGDFLKDQDIDLVFCSPLDRAKYGAERIAESRGLSTHEDDGFREVDRGRWLGLTREQIESNFPGDLDNFAKDPSWCGHGGETYTQLFDRVIAARDRAIARAREGGCKSIAIVSHMWVTKSMITDIQGVAPTEQDKWSELKVPTASISLVNYPLEEGGGEARIEYIGTKPEVSQDEAAKAASTWGG